MRRAHLARGLVAAALASGAASPALAGELDTDGNLQLDPQAVASEGFESQVQRFLPADAPPECAAEAYTLVESDDALEGHAYAHVRVAPGCAERFELALPATQGSYRARLWVRHGSADAQMNAIYPDGSGLDLLVAKLAPTGRTTNDGWVELESNEFPVDVALADHVYVRVYDYATVDGIDVDAVELVAAGSYVEQHDCAGVGDPICGDESVCIHQRCRLGRLYVPPLPRAEIRDAFVDVLAGKLQNFFGGRKTRAEFLPQALATLDALRDATTAWSFWRGWGLASRRLHDWHTSASTAMAGFDRSRRLSVCFFEGDADLTHQSFPKHPLYDDLLVSHTGSDGTQGIAQGDRLVAVDGQHPIAWARSLGAVDWGLWQASDDSVFAEHAERMRGLVIAYATTFSVIHCHTDTQSCDALPETYVVAELPVESGGQVGCDNRPFYHLETGNPGPNHNVGGSFFRGRIADTTPAEAIYGMVWNTLNGGGDPNSNVNTQIANAIADWKQNARGVILDHRTGNGGTLDGAESVTRLSRPKSIVAVAPGYIQIAGDDGPADAAEGIAFFDRFDGVAPYAVGATNYDPLMPVALVLHRDGSASDYMPFGMKGGPKTRLFGPHPTAGAFSTFNNFAYWGDVSWQTASGDTVAADGAPLIGHGTPPDELVLPRQSDLLAGRDSLHEAALAWVRANLKP